MRRLSFCFAVLSLIASSISASGWESPQKARRLNRATDGTSCPPPGAIPNFNASRNGNTVSLTWDAPAGVPGPVYEIVQLQTNTACEMLDPEGFVRTSTLPEKVVGTTQSRSFSTTLTGANQIFGLFVRVAADHCLQTEFVFLFHTYSTPPPKPPTPTATVVNGRITLTYSYSSTHPFTIFIQRASGTDNFTNVGAQLICANNPKTFVDPADGGALANGTYRYRLVVEGVAGDPVTVTVGPTNPARIISFTATPTRIRAGQSATLSFVTTGANSVQINNGVGTVGATGTVTVTPSTTTTYTLTAIGGTTEISSVTIEVLTQPSLNVSSFPAALIQPTGVGGATSTYSVTNNGGSAASVSVFQDGNFFTQSPTSFILNPGQTQDITVTAIATTAGTFDGTALISSPGVGELRVPIRLLSAAPPAAPVIAKTVDNRVDVSGGVNPTGSARFSNTGAGVLTGTVVSDVPWIIPQVTTVTIPPGGTVSVPFIIDRSQRPDADFLVGSQAGSLSLYYISSGAGKGVIGPDQTSGTTINISKSTVVDTVTPATGSGAPPALRAGEVALFIAGLGHVQGTVGLFISDISVLNPLSNRAISDIRFFYTPTTASNPNESRTLNVSLASAAAVTVGDVVKTTFGQDTQGTLQVRSVDADKLNVNATVFNSSNPAGTYGTTIPIIRSDRGVGTGGNVVLTGLRADATSHTNLYLQEVSGTAITVNTEFFRADGSSAGTRSDDLGPFGLKQIGQIVPQGAVSAILTTPSSGRFQAFATPVDRASGDTWSVADWSTFYGYPSSTSTVIPVAGVLQGAGNTFFRTDAAIMNRGTGQASGTLRYFGRTGDQFTRGFTLGSRQAMIINDIVGSFFGGANGSVGFIVFEPTNGDFAITSRTYTTVAGGAATFGTGVPTLARSAALKRGSVRAIASLDDTSVATVIAARPATFRTNFGMMETSGAGAKVRVTLKFTFPAGPKISGVGSASKDYDLAPNQFLLVNGIAADVIGSSRNSLGDLRNIEADFQVISGDGSVIVFTSSVDNGTGDTILRTD